MYNHNEMKQHIVCVNRYLTHKFIIVPIKYRGERNAFIFKIKSVAKSNVHVFLSSTLCFPEDVNFSDILYWVKYWLYPLF